MDLLSNIPFSTSINASESQQNSSVIGDGDLNTTITYCIFTPLSFISVVQNFRVISIVLTMPRRKRKDGNILIAHLSILTILGTFVDGDYILLKFSDLEFIKASFLSCIIRSFTRNILFCIIPLNVAAISYEKTHAYKRQDPCGKFLVGRCISLMWITAVLANLPTVFTIQYSSSSQQCKEKFLLGSFYFASFYEILKIVLFNFTPIGYITRTLVKIRSIVSKYSFYTKKNINSTARQSRLVFYHGLVFAMIWLPAGILLLYYKIYIRLDQNKANMPETGSKAGTPSILYMVLNFGLLLFVSVNPLIHLHLNEHMSGTKWYSFTYQKRIKIKSEVKIGESSRQQESIPDISYSRVSTVHISHTQDPPVPVWNLPVREVLS